MTRTMYDSITPSAIPRDARMVAGYIDGLYAWDAEDWARFPDAVHVTITALGLDHGVCLNLEPNGYWPSDLGVGWVQRARARGVDPSIYLNYQNHLPMVQAAFDRAKVARPHFWGARYDGIAKLLPGLVAKQYAAPEGTGAAHAPGHYDISIVADHWPGVDTEEQDMNGEQAEQLRVLYSTLAERKAGDPRPPVQQHTDFIVNTLLPAIERRPAVQLTPEDRAAIVAEIRSGLAAEVADLIAARLKD